MSPPHGERPLPVPSATGRRRAPRDARHDRRIEVEPAAGTMMLRACTRCGSTDLSIPKFQDGVVPETDNLNEWVCLTCGLKGIPLEFEEEEDLRAFQETVETRPS